jgi:putative flippase GtrA
VSPIGPPATSAAEAPTLRGARFATAMAAVVARLPFGLAGVIAPSLLGYAIINSLTFGLDLSLLTAFHGGLNWPLPLSITLSYATAFGLSFTLNRQLNFRSHRPVGRQLVIYVAVVLINYLVWILGVGDGLAAVGLDYRLARLVAGACEAVYMYLAMRWLVFREPR